MGDSKTITVQTDNGPVVVRKLALGDYAELLRALKKAPELFGKFIDEKGGEEAKGKSNAQLGVELFTEIAPVAIDELCEVLAVPTDKDMEFFKKSTDLADGVDVLVAILDLNDYQRIQRSLKKLAARKTPQDHLPPKQPKSTPAQG